MPIKVNNFYRVVLHPCQASMWDLTDLLLFAQALSLHTDLFNLLRLIFSTKVMSYQAQRHGFGTLLHAHLDAPEATHTRTLSVCLATWVCVLVAVLVWIREHCTATVVLLLRVRRKKQHLRKLEADPRVVSVERCAVPTPRSPWRGWKICKSSL